MEKIEQPSGIEEKENEPHRDTSMWIFRHGEWDYKNDQFTEQGETQAKEAAADLVKYIGPGEIIKFYRSPALRAEKTAQLMQETIKEKIEREKLDINLLESPPRARKSFKNVEFDTEFDEAARRANPNYSKKDLLEFWFSGPKFEGIETPQEVKERFKNAIEKLNKVISRLKPNEPKIHLVIVTHGEVPTPHLDEIFGVKGLTPAKWLRLDFKAGETDKVNYSRISKSGTIETRTGSI